MTDTDTERRPSGEQPVICVKTNNAQVWKWIAGVLAAVMLGGFVTLHVSVARVEEQVVASKEYAEKQWTLQRGLNGALREDTDENTKAIIRLESRP